MKKLGKIQTLAIAALSAVALAGGVALAQTAGDGHKGHESHGEWRGGRGGRGHRGGGHFGGAMFRGLNLTEEQQARVRQLQQSFDERTKPLREQLRTNRQELRQASEGGTFNETLATQKLTEAAGLQAKLMGEQFKLHQEMLSVLTPEQKTQLEQRRAQFEAKRGERRGRQAQ
jgi:Spy/CpxP family protein refolding chaperone